MDNRKSETCDKPGASHARRHFGSKFRGRYLTMKRIRCFQYAAAAIATLGMVTPPGALAADASRAAVQASRPETPAVLDVGLGEGGTLVGQVVNAQGAPLAKASVTVRCSGSAVASAVTDRQGSFAVGGLQGGVFEVNSAGGSGVYRLWTAGASPPSANKGVLIVGGEPVSRGQYYAGRYYRSRFTNGQIVFGTAIILGVTAAVVAASLSNQAQLSGS